MIQTNPDPLSEKCGSRCVDAEGVPTTGVIDTGSDITIIRGDLFYYIVEKANLKIEDLKAPQQKAVPSTKSLLLWMDK